MQVSHLKGITLQKKSSLMQTKKSRKGKNTFSHQVFSQGFATSNRYLYLCKFCSNWAAVCSIGFLVIFLSEIVKNRNFWFLHHKAWFLTLCHIDDNETKKPNKKVADPEHHLRGGGFQNFWNLWIFGSCYQKFSKISHFGKKFKNFPYWCPFFYQFGISLAEYFYIW